MAKKSFIGALDDMPDLQPVNLNRVKKNIVILDEFKNFIPPVSAEEYILLEKSILDEGCRDALIVWENPQKKGKYILIDGHNRFSVCSKHQIDFQVKVKDFKTEDEAQFWMIDNQLGKRNLTENQKSYLRGKQYHREKKKVGGSGSNQYNNSNVDKMSTLQRTIEKIAEQHKVSSKTVQRDEKYAENIDKLTGKDIQMKWKILKKEIDIPKNALSQVNKLADDEIKHLRQTIKQDGDVKSILQEFKPVKTPDDTKTILVKEQRDVIIQTIRDAVRQKDKKGIDEAISALRNLRKQL